MTQPARSPAATAARIVVFLGLAAALIAGITQGIDIARRLGEREAPPPGPIAAADAQALASELRDALVVCDHERAQRLVDLEYIVHRALGTRTIDDERRREIARAIAESGLLRQFCASVQGNAGIELISVTAVEGDTRRAVLRVLSENALDYFVIEIGDTGRGVPAIFDVNALSAGTRLSEAIAELIPALGGSPDERAVLTIALAQLRAALRARDLPRARRALAAIPPAFRDQRSVMLAEVRVAQLDGPAQQRAAFDRFRARYPDDGALPLQSMDLLVREGRYDDALAEVDALDAVVGGDPWLEVVRSNIELARGDRDAAWRYADAARRRRPEMVAIHWHALSVALGRSDWTTAIEIIDTLQQHFGIELGPEHLEADPIYAGLLASDAWRARQP